MLKDIESRGQACTDHYLTIPKLQTIITLLHSNFGRNFPHNEISIDYHSVFISCVLSCLQRELHSMYWDE